MVTLLGKMKNAQHTYNEHFERAYEQNQTHKTGSVRFQFIKTSLLNCADCKPTKGCHSFTVIDDECDSFNFYWDSSRRTLAWWRQ